MKRWLFIGAVLAGCSSSSAPAGMADSGPNAMSPAEGDASPDGPGVSKTSWTYVYGAYFGPGSLGNCGSSSCHLTVRRGFACGATKDACYAGLIAKGLIGTDAAVQPLIDPMQTPLAWFNSGGSMPQDSPIPNPVAAKELEAWVSVGAKND